MDLSQNRLKSLKGTLLEHAVLSLHILFPHDDVDSFPTLPRFMFDEILEKSKDMCWPLRPEHLKSCIAAKDRLGWSAASIFRSVNYFGAKDLALFKDTMSTAKVLRVDVVLRSPADVSYFKEIRKSVGTLEDLQLTITTYLNGKDMPDRGGYSMKTKASIGTCKRPFRLKRFSLKAEYFDNFPFAFDHNRLTVFEIDVIALTPSLLATLSGLKQLERLSLSFTHYKQFTLESVIDAVALLKKLRFLGLFPNEPVDEQMLNRIVDDLESLEILELCRISLERPKRLAPPRRQLEVLNCGDLDGTFLAPLLANLARRVGHTKSLDGMATLISTTMDSHLYTLAMTSLAELLRTGRVAYEELAAAERSGEFRVRSPMRLSEGVYSGVNGNASYNWILRLACNMRFHANGCRMPNDWILNYVKHYGNTHLGCSIIRDNAPWPSSKSSVRDKGEELGHYYHRLLITNGNMKYFHFEPIRLFFFYDG